MSIFDVIKYYPINVDRHTLTPFIAMHLASFLLKLFTSMLVLTGLLIVLEQIGNNFITIVAFFAYFYLSNKWIRFINNCAVEFTSAYIHQVTSIPLITVQSILSTTLNAPGSVRLILQIYFYCITSTIAVTLML